MPTFDAGRPRPGAGADRRRAGPALQRRTSGGMVRERLSGRRYSLHSQERQNSKLLILQRISIWYAICTSQRVALRQIRQGERKEASYVYNVTLPILVW
jgi:hypothetical protein